MLTGLLAPQSLVFGQVRMKGPRRWQRNDHPVTHLSRGKPPADQSHRHFPVHRWQHTHSWMVSPPSEQMRRQRGTLLGVIRVSGLIGTPGFNSHRQRWSSHQRSISAKLQLSHSQTKKTTKKRVNNLPVSTVNVLMCVLRSDTEESLKCSVALSPESKLY